MNINSPRLTKSQQFIFEKMNREINNWFDVEFVNNFISNLNLKSGTKKIYSLVAKKVYESNNRQDLTSKLKIYNQEFSKKQSLTIEQIQKIKNILKTNKEKFLFNLFLHTGIRINEYSSLLNSLNQESEKAYFLCSKNGKLRYAWVPKFLFDFVNGWNYKLLTERQIRSTFENINKRAKKLGIITQKLHPHLMRHTCGSLLRSRGASSDDIADYLADDVATVRKYYISSNADHMILVGKLTSDEWINSYDIQTSQEVIFRLNRLNNLLFHENILLKEEIEKLKNAKNE